MLRGFCGINQGSFLFYVFKFVDISRTAFEVDISLYLISLSTALVCSIFQVWQIFQFLYLVCVKIPISLWRLKEPHGSKQMQNQLLSDEQLILPFWNPVTISFCTCDGFNLPGIMVIYYNFHPYRKKKINSEINFILLK